MNREELVEAARRDIADAERCQAMHITPATGTLLRRLREVTNALAAEQAHTPTDDEREAPASTSEVAAIIDRAMRPWGLSNIGTHTAARALVAAGFRRTVQGEPSDADTVLSALAVRLNNEAYGKPDFEWGQIQRQIQGVEMARAALRAAAATQEGESRV